MNESAMLLIFIALIALMGLIPAILQRFGIPMVIALLIVGMLIAPNGIGIDLVGHLSRMLSFLDTSGDSAEFAATTASVFNTFVSFLGSLGLMLLMALAGMEADFKLISTVRKPVIALTIATFLVPAITGYLVYDYFVPDSLSGKLLYASLFASHSVGIVFPVIRAHGLTRSRFGASVLISTVLTDIASIVLLAVSVQLYRQHSGVSHMVGKGTLSLFDHLNSSILGNSFMPIFLLIVLLYLGISMFVVSKVGNKLLTWFNPSEDMLITIVLLVILATVLVGELFGINLVVGAFIAGLGLSKVVRGQEMLLFKRVESIGYGFLIPFLFVSIGMKTDFSAFTQGTNVAIVLATVIGLVGSKLLSGYFTMRAVGFSHAPSLAAGFMTVPQLSATLAAAAVGRDLGILDGNFFNAIIILSIVTTLPIPNMVRWVISKHSAQFPANGDYDIPQVVHDNELL